MAAFEALYERRCRSPIGWFEVREPTFIGPDSILEAMDKVQLIHESLKTAHSHQKSYIDMRRREIEFEVGDWVFLKVSPMKAIMRFGNKRKLSLQFISPYEVVKWVGEISYEFDLPSELATVIQYFMF